MSKKKTVFVVGPTASGKTSLAIELAKEFSGEIISADSMQIYKGIHIASAAPDETEKCGVPHHLIEFLDLDRSYSVADYVKDARNCIDGIIKKEKVPIVTGGTGLYVSSLLDNTEYTEQKTDLSLRNRLEKEFESLGGEKMLKRLAEFDSESAKKLHPNDRRRIIRCFEIFEGTGKTMTEQNFESHNIEPPTDNLVIGLNFINRELLYERINKRVDIMLEKGLLEEARTTFKKSDSTGAYQAIGHKELYEYLRGNCSLSDAIEFLKQQTRRYAKRQLTWFRKDNRINWIYVDECSDVFSTAAAITKEFLGS